MGAPVGELEGCQALLGQVGHSRGVSSLPQGAGVWMEPGIIAVHEQPGGC